MQRISSFKSLMILLSFFTFHSCEKEFLPEDNLEKIKVASPKPIVFNVTDSEKIRVINRQFLDKCDKTLILWRIWQLP